MVVKQVDVRHSLIVSELKDDSPVCVDANCPVPTHLAMQAMEPKPTTLEILGTTCDIEQSQDGANSGKLVWPYATRVAVLPQPT